jgi:hypothetical protein
MHVHLARIGVFRLQRIGDGGLGIGPDLGLHRVQLLGAGHALIDQPCRRNW